MIKTANERGFSLIEVLIAAAVFIVMMGTAFGAIALTSNVMRTAATTQRGADAIDRQIAELRAEAATASAVFVPPRDLHGADNADGHEVDFYAKGQANRDVYWRYAFDPETSTLRRYDYDPQAGGSGGVRDAHTGAIDDTASYPEIPEVTAFSARVIEANELADSAKNRYAAVFPRVPSGEPVSLNDPASGRDVAGLIGGNRVVEVQLANRKAARVVHVSAGTMPTGFYVGGNIKFHTVLYRVDQSHRFWFGVAGKSHVWIRGRASITYDDWATGPRVWCDYPIYGGQGGDGLDPSDPHTNFHALQNDANAQPKAILDYCAQHAAFPERVAAYSAPDPYRTPASILDTPPPCWSNPGTGERCWPAEAPVDWAPSPRPADTPPPHWCATHTRSRACPGGTGTAVPSASASPPAASLPPADAPSDISAPAGSGASASPAGASQSGAYQSGAYQSGASQSGAYQSGASQSGASQSGASQSGASQTGASQTGASQTGASQAGISPDGTPGFEGSSPVGLRIPTSTR